MKFVEFVEFVELIEFVGLIKTETGRDTIETVGDTIERLWTGDTWRFVEIQWRYIRNPNAKG